MISPTRERIVRRAQLPRWFIETARFFLLVCALAFQVGGTLGCASHRDGAGPTDQGPTSDAALDDAALDDAGAAPDTLGTVSLQLQVAPGIPITSVGWSVHNPALLPSDRTGTVGVANSQAIQFVIGGLPAGPDYSVIITASTDSGSLTCVGSASFGITANATTSVDIVLLCSSSAGDSGSAQIDGTTTIAPSCAAVTSLSASPSEVNLGGSVHLAAKGVDATGGNSDLTFSWSMDGGPGAGSFSSASVASPTFTCTAPGTVTVTVAASITSAGGNCTGNTGSLRITCDPKKVAALSVGPHDHVCALLANGGVECWGGNVAGQLGNATTDSALTPTAVQNLGGATAVTLGNTHTCALLLDGTVACWGAQNMLGTGMAGGLDDCGGLPCSMKPVAVAGLTGVIAIAAGSTHTCALLSGGTVRCWGDNSSGQLGDGTTNSQLATVPVMGVTGATAITAGDSDTCALLSGGTVLCWGYNFSGQLGGGVTGPDNCGGYPCSLKPVAVAGLTGAKAIAAGGSHTCAVLSDGTAECWGFNDVGELGNGTKTTSTKPVAVSNLTGIVSLATGVYHTCATLSGGTVSCWGDNSKGQFCDGTTTSQATPTVVSNLASATAVSAGNYETCAKLPGGQIVCCGQNTRGQLGNGTANPSLIPVMVNL